MSVLSAAYFHDEAAAFAHVEATLWESGPICPHCGGMDRAYALNNVMGKTGKLRHGLKKCGHCRKQFTVRIGTIFEESHLPLHKWLQAIYLMCSSKKGVSAHQLHRTLEVTYKTAWFLAHRIREAMRTGELAPMGGAGAIVEADETYFGDKEVVTHRTKRGMKGIYQHCSEKHLHRYLAEFDFRFNNRIALGIGDQNRASNALKAVVGKRLTYQGTN